MTSKEYKDGAKILIEIINSYTPIGKAMLKDIAGKDSSYPIHNIILMLERITYNSIVIKLALEEYVRTGDEHLEYPMGILFRNCSSDIITVLYLNYLGGDLKMSDEQIEERVQYHMAEEILKAIEFFEVDDDEENSPEKNAKKERYLSITKNIAKEYPHFFDLNSENRLINKLRKDKAVGFSTTRMINEIQAYLKHFKHLDVMWKGYSQYEHLGGLTYGLMRQSFDMKIHDMSHSLWNILQAMHIMTRCIVVEGFDNKKYTPIVEEALNNYCKHFPPRVPNT